MTMTLDSHAPSAASTPAEMSSGAAQHTTNATKARTPRRVGDRVDSFIGVPSSATSSSPCPAQASDPFGADATTRGQMVAVLLGQLTAVFQDAPHPSVGNPVRHLAASALGFDEAAPPQTRQVIRHPALTDAQRVDQL